MAKVFTEEQLEAIITDYVSKLGSHINIQNAILYGSYAKGNAHEWSDIDLLIVSSDLPERAPKGKNGFYLDSLVGSVNTSLEVIGAHPSKLEHPVTKSFFDEILATGKHFTINPKS